MSIGCGLEAEASHVRYLSLLLLVLANALWGSSYVVAKVALEEIPPALLAALRFSIAAVVFWFVLLTRGRPKLPNWPDALRLLGIGAVGIGLNGILGFWGVSLTTATDAALLIVGEVVFTSLFAIALTSDRLTAQRAIALLVGVLGAVVLILGGATAST